MKLIYLEWEDAVSNARWFSKKELEWFVEDADAWLVREAGWLISETKRYIIIATSYKPADEYTDEQFCNLHKIPKTWIRKRKTLMKS